MPVVSPEQHAALNGEVGRHDVLIRQLQGRGAVSLVQDEGVALPQQSKLNFIGAGVVATDDPTNKRTNVTVTAANAPAKVTSLPGSPVDGQEVYWQVSAGPPAVVWHMRRNASANKWEFVGGPPITFLMEGQNAAYVNFSTGTNITVNAAQNVALQWNITPAIDMWAEIEFHLGLVLKVDANYHDVSFNTMVTGALASGTQAAAFRTQHASVQRLESYVVRSLLGLSAGVSYAIFCQTTVTGGTWQYHQGPNVLHLNTKAWPR